MDGPCIVIWTAAAAAAAAMIVTGRSKKYECLTDVT